MNTNARPDCSEQTLRWTHELLCRPHDIHDVDDLLEGLKTALTARSAGLAVLIGNRPLVFASVGAEPIESVWMQNDHTLDDIRDGAVSIRQEDSSVLASVLRGTESGDWLVWASDDGARSWSMAERAALTLAGQAILPVLARSSPAFTRLMASAQVRRQLIEAARTTGRLSHDFSNMLTAILGFAELSLTQMPREGLPARFVREIWQSANDAAHWVRKLQLFCRDVTSNLPPADVAAVLAQEQKRLRTLWGADVALLIDVAHDLPQPALDAECLRHILEQLLQNAREAIAERGMISVVVREVLLSDVDCLQLLGEARPGPHLEIAITDNGAGISEEVRRQLLREGFFSTKGRHRGLGLPIVYGILRNHGGGLRIGSAAPQGTVVKVYLPVASNSPVEDKKGKLAATPLNGKRVLFSEDMLTIK